MHAPNIPSIRVQVAPHSIRSNRWPPHSIRSNATDLEFRLALHNHKDMDYLKSYYCKHYLVFEASFKKRRKNVYFVIFALIYTIQASVNMTLIINTVQ